MPGRKVLTVVFRGGHQAAVAIVMSLLVFVSLSGGFTSAVVAAPTAHPPGPALPPAHVPTGPPAKPGPAGVDVYGVYSAEPAPMGIADYGVGPNGPYNYTTMEVLGEVSVNSLHAQNSTGDPWVTFQLNVVLPVDTVYGLRVYWIQDVVQFDTSTGQANFLDNVWNFSSSSSPMEPTGISGGGQISTYTGGQTFYYAWASGNPFSFVLPTTIKLLVVAGTDSSNRPTVNFEYDAGSGFQSFDTVTFTSVRGLSGFAGFEVSGFQYTPDNHFYDSELIFGGGCCGYNTINIQSDVGLALFYWNGNNLQTVSNAYNFGSDTAEGSSNVEALWYYYFAGGEMFSKILPGSGSLGKLYDQSEIGTFNINTNARTGTLYVQNATNQGASPDQYVFTNGAVDFAVYPGTYLLQLYVNGALYDSTTKSIGAGQTLQLVSPFGDYQMTMSYSVAGGTSGSLSPTLTYVHAGSTLTVPLTTVPTVYYMDPGTVWTLAGNYTSGAERWVETQPASGTASSFQATVFTFYHQFSVTTSYSVSGGGSPSPPALAGTAFGASYRPALSTSPQRYWLDAGTAWTVTNPLPGSGPSERWQTGEPSAGTVSASTIVSPVYYHQFALTLSYDVFGGGAPQAPALTGEQFGQNYTAAVTAKASPAFLDAGSQWSVPSLLAGSNSLERWSISGQTNGTMAGPASATLGYHHQYYLEVTSWPSGGGSVSPSAGWHDSGTSLQISASPSTGWKFEGWTGAGAGSYTGLSNQTSFTLAAPTVENATFYPGLTIFAGANGRVSYSFGGTKGAVQGGASATIFAPLGTAISLQASPSYFLFAFAGWTPSAAGTGSQANVVLSSPASITAAFALDVPATAALVVLVLALIAGSALFLRRRARAAAARAGPVATS
ncbi:MAG: thermopsin [Nitrososphaerota archaeon]|nr:thermopsin [Nitrososphaerota archaeon]